MFRVFAVALMLGLLAVSCRKKSADEALSPPETPLFLKEGVGYGVVNASFANVRGEPHAAAVSTGLIRKGSVVVVIERRAVPVAEDPNGAMQFWAFVETQVARDEVAGTRLVAGWLLEDSMDFYASLPKAETASTLMTR
ncbi:MAG: hypothetical protein LBG27_05390 [Spirochaetaceae bacterium]|jgi:hypothetical protein|nr:hypothetical protein [Spirochaetaceae bacterium]